MSNLSRRQFLEASVFAGASTMVATRFALANAPTDSRFVFVLLRGALDGLSAVPPVGDPDYAGLRGQIALPRSGEGAALPLAGPFGLFRSLTFLHASYQAKELAVLHAIATPYRERSHFDAQNVLESGDNRPHGSSSGWINRALSALPAGKSRGGKSREADAAPMTSATNVVAEDARQKRNCNARYAETARAAAGFLKRDDGPRVAMFDTTGWDTHANEGGAQGQLAL